MGTLKDNIKSLEETVKYKDAIIKAKDANLEEAGVKYEAMLRETLKAYGTVNEGQREVIQNITNLPDHLKEAVTGKMNELSDRIANRMTDLAKELETKTSRGVVDSVSDYLKKK